MSRLRPRRKSLKNRVEGKKSETGFHELLIAWAETLDEPVSRAEVEGEMDDIVLEFVQKFREIP